MASSSQAKKLYKFKDSNGTWHFTDKAPHTVKTTQDIKVTQLVVEEKQRVWLKKNLSTSDTEYFVQNDYYGPIEIEIELAKNFNTATVPSLPKRFVVGSRQTKRVFGVKPINIDQRWSYQASYRYILGDPIPGYFSNYQYLPPLEQNDQYPVTQAFDGQFSHFDDQNRFAVDIAMPIGTPVYAARSGIVMEVKNDYFNVGTDNISQKTNANSIRILHTDGSMAIYAHLQLEKAQVYPGMKVAAGKLIAYSGNTGFSTGPHLHFAIQHNQGFKLVSTPFKFVDEEGESFEPVAGMWLRGLKPSQNKRARLTWSTEKQGKTRLTKN
ncbi:MAG: M23 family metallopeptidase [Methylococcaceae bacterium]